MAPATPFQDLDPDTDPGTNHGTAPGTTGELGLGVGRWLRRWQPSLLTRLVLALLLVSLLPLGLAAWQLVGLNADALEDQVLRTQLVAARSAADRASTWIEAQRRGVEGLAATPSFADDPTAATGRELLATFLETQPETLGLVVQAGSGAEVIRAQHGDSAPLVNRALDDLGDDDGPRLVTSDSAGALLVTTARLAGRQARLVAVSDAGALEAAVEPFELGDDAHFALASAERVLLGSVDDLRVFPPAAVEQAATSRMWGAGRYDDAGVAPGPEAGPGARRAASGEPVLAAFSTVEGTPWFILASQSAAVAEAVARRTGRRAAWSVALALVLAGLLAVGAWVSVVRPLERVVATQRRLAGETGGGPGAPRMPTGDVVSALEQALGALERRLTDQEEVGEVFLDRYRVLEVLGSGAMGTVFRGWDPKLERPVALKTVRLDATLDEDKRQRLVERLVREAVTGARFSHPHIVQVFDVEASDRAAFVAMELIRGTPLGTTLTEHLAGGRRYPSSQAVPLGAAVARALDAAHRAGFLHRDIKPGNVLLGEDGTIKVSDFGIAESISRITAEPGKVFGTPGFIPPEVLSGAPFDERGDLFALGVVLYRTLTGAPPFGTGRSREMLRRTVAVDPVPPDERMPGIDPYLASMILALLEKDPRKRPTEAALVADRLDELARRHAWRWRPEEPPVETGRSWLEAERSSPRLVPTLAPPSSEPGVG